MYCSETPLHIAASMGYAEAARILLNHGAGRKVYNHRTK
jgi:hypothetical protein